ncbi:alpha/beta hydrolase [Acrocarpospora phusangensis]|uniref:Alpha/beta hydrolase n=1 Tax=Acrocarpospora phusangensis TaxID=1070424 RepID=A0A919Q5X8_9ACTN|nr:alpha/beta hydrolase [Acrocarpospora phusangensis]GIH22538.1 alpha/beta hydrolase [Acrocarpospora phusangensis]
MTVARSPRPAQAGSGVHLECGGGQGPAVVFLHGSAASGAVWKPVTRALARRRPDAGWLLADLPGHGRSRWQLDYSPDGYADAVAAAIREHADGRPVHLVGHSLGAMVALALADGTRGVVPASVLVLAMKVSWTETELTRRAAAATRPIRVLPAPEQARELFGRISGMGAGFTEDDLDSGIAVTEGGYRLSGDPRITAAPPATAAELAALAARAICPVRLACGDRDPGIRYGDLADTLGRPVTVLPDTAHNAHIEHPDLVAELVEQALR